MEYDNNNSGILFKNDYKEAGSKQPDYKGSFTDADGQEKDLAAWVRTAKSGKSFLSVKVSDKFVKPDAEQGAPFNDPIPAVNNEEPMPF